MWGRSWSGLWPADCGCQALEESGRAEGADLAKLSRSGAILSLLVVVVAAMAAGVVLLGKGRAPGAGGQVGAGDWPTYMYDGARSGFNRQETLLSPDNAANLRLLWK